MRCLNKRSALNFLKSFLFVPLLFCSASLLAEDWPGNSLFHLDSTWINQDSKELKLSDLSGKPFLLSMVFLSCDYSCPVTVQDLKQISSKLAKKKKKDIPVVLITIDPQNDTPAAMQKYIKSRGLDKESWTILSSSQDNIREVAAALGFSYRKDDAMGFAHSMLMWVIDKKGVPQFTREGRKQSIDEVVKSALSLRE